jgi:hypothetical protein
LTPEVRAYVAQHVDGFDEFELLVALSERRGSCAFPELALAMRQSPLELASLVDRLRGRRLLAEAATDGWVRLADPDPRLAVLVDVYRRDPVVVLRLLNELAIERLRLGATRAFADAFLVRSRKPDG